MDAFEQVNYCTAVFNKVTECTGHSGSCSAVQTAALSLNSVELFRAFYELFHFIFSAHSLVSAQAAEIVCDSSNSTLSAQVYLNTAAAFSGIVPGTQEGGLPQCLPLLMRTYSLTHGVYNLRRTLSKFQVFSFFSYLLLLGSAAVLFT